MIPPVSNSRNSIQVGRLNSLLTRPPRRGVLSWPPFSSLPLLFLVMVKPLTDAFYEVEAVKYGYVLLLVFASLFARYGQESQGYEADPRNKSLLIYIYLIALYSCFLFGLATTYGGSWQELFKIISPFVFFVLVAYSADRWLIYALAGGAVLTIVINAALVPFNFGWVMWGSVKTFKGYYFFKTDLAYALSFSVLIYAFYARNSITPVLALLTLIAAVEVVLANSRLNYLSFSCVVIFLAVKEGISLRSTIRYSLLFGLLSLVVVFLYDPTKLLGFDAANEEAFTQGRNAIWGHLLAALADYSPLEWLFGRGQEADSILSAEFTGAGHNAHNEILHLLYTQGVFGSVFYIFLWLKMFRISHSPEMPQWARGAGALALLLFLLQGMTAVMSSYATKTWPLVMMLLALRGLGNVAGQHKQAVSPS